MTEHDRPLPVRIWIQILRRILGRYYADYQPLTVAVGLGFGLLALSGNGLGVLWITALMIGISVGSAMWQERRWSA